MKIYMHDILICYSKYSFIILSLQDLYLMIADRFCDILLCNYSISYHIVINLNVKRIKYIRHIILRK